MNSLVTACGQHPVASWGEQHPVDLRLRLRQRVEPQPIGSPPELHRLISTGRSQQPTAGVPGQIEDSAVVDGVFPVQAAVGHPPDFHRRVIASGRQQAAIGGELRVIEEIAVALESFEQFACGGIPQFGQTEQPRQAAGKHQPFSGRIKMHRRDLARQIRNCLGCRQLQLPRWVSGNQLEAAAPGHGQPISGRRDRHRRDRLAAGIVGQGGYGQRGEDRAVLSRPRGSGGNPGLDRGDCLSRQLRLFEWRHVVGVGAANPFNHHRAVDVAGADRIAGKLTPPPKRGKGFHRQATLGVTVVVAAGTVRPQQRSDVVLVGGGREGRHRTNQQEADEQSINHEQPRVEKTDNADSGVETTHPRFLSGASLRNRIGEGRCPCQSSGVGN